MKNESKLGITMSGSYRKVILPLGMQFKTKGRALVQVLDHNKLPIQAIEVDNLILNQGLDFLATRRLCDCFLYCAAGSGSTATSVSGGVTVAVQSGTSVTLSGGSFTFTDTATDAGKVIRWDSGSEARIVTVTNSTTAVVNVSQSVPSGTFTVYNTTQVGLTTEIQRTNNYIAGVGNCGTSLASNVFSHKRTFDFPAEVGGATYREIGFSYTNSAGNNLFSRLKLPLDLVLVAGQVLRVVYTLQMTVTPSSPVTKSASITGWPVAPSVNTDGTEQIQLWGLSSIDTSGATVAYDNGGFVNEPSEITTAYIFLSTATAAVSAIGSTADRTGTSPVEQVVTLTTYVPLAFTFDKTTTFDTPAGNATNWRTIGLGRTESSFHSYTANSLVFVFDQDQTKDNQHTLQINFTFTWGRDLS